MISSIPRFLGSSDSLDYANRWRSPHGEPPSDSDRKSCSTRGEISSPGVGTAHEAPIQNRHFDPTTISPIPRILVSSDSLDYANRWRSPHGEPPSHSDQKSSSTRREISSPGRGYGCLNIADIVVDMGARTSPI
ncbi:hypothetical protein Taro_056344 [Colocasia esculenta]|uniref:Uncharacterized protein n=1 Tax=Colocasia esculenta TaxID=4460 RepID=A0A843XWC3_COLES|nr:hypothetical protein [Colocasia esculenta]